VSWNDLAGVGLLALAGFLVGGVYATWRTARTASTLLIVAAALAAAGGVVWLL
jgi:hypothetical protein